MCIRKNLRRGNYQYRCNAVTKDIIVVGFSILVYFAFSAQIISLSLRNICISGCILKYCFRVHNTCNLLNNDIGSLLQWIQC